eukprot:4267209-Pyramimonas_sp.AAC.1
MIVRVSDCGHAGSQGLGVQADAGYLLTRWCSSDVSVDDVRVQVCSVQGGLVLGVNVVTPGHRAHLGGCDLAGQQ